MVIEENYSLQNLNTLRVPAKTRYFAKVETLEDIQNIFDDLKLTLVPKFILGDGSNTLFARDFDGLVVKSAIKGRKVVEETKEYVIIECGSGENWHELVTYAVENNWGGIENLVLVPGTVGAAPVQNIACYGQNLVDVFDLLDAVNLETYKVEKFTRATCEFGYRESVFKSRYRGKYLVVSVRIKLSKHPTLNTSYWQTHIIDASVKDELTKLAKEPYSIRDVYQAIINIRSRKLPDPKITPTCGSFFLNPTITKEKLAELQTRISDLQFYPMNQLSYKELNDPIFDKDKYVKVPAGWLLQEIGWLSKWEGNVGVHDKHALILVTNGKASGQEILRFAHKMQKSFNKAYGLDLKIEVNVV